MTVLLAGIGADTTNCSPTPRVSEDGRFEYIPIPESHGPDGTTETRTYGNTTLRHSEAPMAEYLDAIRPRPRTDGWLTGEELAEWPMHFDPNLEVLTYGETASRPAYIRRLRTLRPGDLVAFYTGLQSAAHGQRDRYIIGAFTVASILDCQQVRLDGGSRRFSALSTATQRELMGVHAANAHAKRFMASGEIADDDGLLIVDGTEPGGLLDRAVRISASNGTGHHYLRQDLHARWRPQGCDPEDPAYLGGIKQAHLLDIDPASFWEDVT